MGPQKKSHEPIESQVIGTTRIRAILAILMEISELSQHHSQQSGLVDGERMIIAMMFAGDRHGVGTLHIVRTPSPIPHFPTPTSQHTPYFDLQLFAHLRSDEDVDDTCMERNVRERLLTNVIQINQGVRVKQRVGSIFLNSNLLVAV